MRILDIDLDFFLDDIIYFGSDDRPESAAAAPWSESQVRDFLETHCGLSTAHPVKGRIVTHHVEVFLDWREKIESGVLSTPFDIVHVDAHADLGLGDAAYHFISTQMTNMPLHERPYASGPSQQALGSGNYLAYAAACRWIKSLTYVHHPDGGDDLMSQHMKNEDVREDALQLKYYGPIPLGDLELDTPIVSLEPAIPFILVVGSDYQNDQPFDMIYLAKSPDYAPAEADVLIDVIREYIR